VRYVELALRFQDTILGHLYGVREPDAGGLEKLTFLRLEAHEC